MSNINQFFPIIQNTTQKLRDQDAVPTMTLWHHAYFLTLNVAIQKRLITS